MAGCPCTEFNSVSLTMKTFLIILLAVTVASAAKTHQKRSVYSASLNEYVDKVIANLQQYLIDNDANEMSLPNVTQTFSTKPVWITYSGRLSLFNGILSNLASVRRYGDVDITYGEKLVAISANLGCDSLGVVYDYEAKLVGISADGWVDGSVAKLDTTITLNGDFAKYEITDGEFVINDLGSVSAQLKGNWVTDWLANAILAIVIAAIESDVVDSLNDGVNDALSGIITDLNESIAESIAALTS